MKVLPYLEDIYDMETGQLEDLLAMLDTDMFKGEGNCTLPEGVPNFQKYEKKANKLKESVELELEERSQVDNVINFFSDSSKQYLDDDQFYKVSTEDTSKMSDTMLKREIDP